MKNYQIFTIYLLYFVLSGFTQNEEIVYLILTSTSQEVDEGIERSTLDEKDLKYPAIYFNILSKQRNVCEYYAHFNYKREELSKIRPVEANDEMEIITRPRAFLNTIEKINMDVFKNYSEEYLKKLGRSFKGKKIYIIDKNDMTTDSIKLIQVEYIDSSF